MGILENIRNFFRGSNDTPVIQEDDSYKKSILATQIVNSIDKIKRINSFDSSIWNLANVSIYDLQRKSLAELQQIKSTLDNRLSELTRQSQSKDHARESLEESKWTGRKPKNMTDHDFDRFQRDEGR